MMAFEEVRAGFQAALVALTDFIRVDRVLSAQIAAGRQEFFGTDAPLTTEAGAAADAQRFLEWFALERRAAGTGGPPVVAFLGAGCPGLPAETHRVVESLQDSRVGVFAVVETDDDGLDVEDAVSGEGLRVWMPRRERRAEAGATLIGRLASVPGEDRWLALESSEVVPGTTLFTAYAEAAQERRLAGDGADPVLSQLEIEKLLRAGVATGSETPADVERDFAAFFAAAGGPASLPSVEEISHALSSNSRPGSVIGPLLERIAFHTDLDLEAAQRLCLRLWNAHQAQRGDLAVAPEPATAPAPRVAPQELGRRVLAELEQGLARGEDLEVLFDRLESMVGRDEEDVAEVEEELRWHVDDEGNLQALIEEFLWERDTEGPPLADSDVQHLRELASCWLAQDVRDVEEVQRVHLAAALVDRWTAGGESECFAILEIAATWTEWLMRTQELSLRAEPRAFLARLQSEQQRTQRLATALCRIGASHEPRRTWVVHDGDGHWRLVGGPHELRLPRELPFEAGDVVFGVMVGDGFAEGLQVVPAVLAAAMA